MKNQALFSSKDKSKKLKFSLLQFLLSALMVNFSNNLGFVNAHLILSNIV